MATRFRSLSLFTSALHVLRPAPFIISTSAYCFPKYRNMSSIPKPVRTSGAAPPAGPYSQAIRANGLLFVSGQIPADSEGNVIEGAIEECTEAVFTNLAAVLKAGGSSFNKVLKTTVFLADMGDFARMNSVYEKYFSAHKPARSCVAVKTLPKNVQVEIECIALEDHTPERTSGTSTSRDEEDNQ